VIQIQVETDLLRRRGVSAGTISDLLHSTDEARFVTIGVTPTQRLLVVVHTDRGGRIRIISARPATRAEKKKHEEDEDEG
jgi:uncharacterized protein